jgi:hypothetical protein
MRFVQYGNAHIPKFVFEYRSPDSFKCFMTATMARITRPAVSIALLLAAALPLTVHANEDGYRLLELGGFKLKWDHHQLGVGAKLSYAFADEYMQFDGARNCAGLRSIKALSGPDLSFEALERETAAAFRIWEEAANLSFHRVDNPADADIVIGAQAQPLGKAFANVSYLPDAQDGVRLIDQALICLNPEHDWKIGFDGNTDVYDIRYTLIHEIGHAVGLDHPGPAGQIMGFRYTERFAELQYGDLRGIRQLYGPPTDDPQQTATVADARLSNTSPAAGTIETEPTLSIE